MKTSSFSLWAPLVLVVWSFSAQPVFTQKNAAPSKKPTSPTVSKSAPAKTASVPAVPAGMQAGFDLLQSRNATAAAKAFKKAKKGAEKAQQKQCKQLAKVSRLYDKNYFQLLNKASRWKSTGEYKRIMAEYDLAKAEFIKINRLDVAALLKPTDQHLLKTHVQELEQFDKSRKKAYAKALEEAGRLSATNPDAAMKKIEYARNQMTTDELSKAGTGTVERDVKYFKLLMEGDSLVKNDQRLYTDIPVDCHYLFSSEHCPGEAALAKYLAAQKVKDSPEIRVKIKDQRAKLCDFYLREGDSRIKSRDYYKAAEFYKKALEHTENKSEVESRQQHWSNILLEEGKKAFSFERYRDAESNYIYAGAFYPSEAITRARDEVRPFARFLDYYERAIKKFHDGNAAEAQRDLKQALGYRSTPEAEDLRIKLETYFENVNEGRRLLNAGRRDNARWQVNVALRVIPNGWEALKLKQDIDPPPATKQ